MKDRITPQNCMLYTNKLVVNIKDSVSYCLFLLGCINKYLKFLTLKKKTAFSLDWWKTECIIWQGRV